MKRRVAAGVVIVAAAIAVSLYRCDARVETTREHASVASTTRAPKARGSAADAGELALHAANRTRLEGEVIDDRDQPVGSAVVRVMPEQQTTTTEADGSFAFDDLPLGNHQLTAVAGELSTGGIDMRLVADSEPIILHARRGTTVIVHVSDTHGVVIGAIASFDGVIATTDATGTVRVPGVYAGYATIDVSAAHHVERRLDVELGFDPGGTVDTNAVLAIGAPVDGTVIGPDNAPVADAAVEIEQNDEPAVSARSDGSGHWHVDAAAAGASKAQARADAVGISVPIELALDGTTARHGVVLKLAAGHAMVGDVVDANGAAIGGADVTATRDQSDAWHVTADARGHFVVEGPSDGRWQVYATRGSLASAIVDPVPATPVRLVASASRIAGVVVDASHQPVADIEVILAWAYPTTRTDSLGHFEFVGMPQQIYRPFLPNRSIKRIADVRPGDADLTMELDGATIRGRVMFDGAPLSVFAIDSSYARPTTFRSTAGRFEIHDLEPGRVDVRIVGEATGSWRQRFTIAAGATVDLGDIELHAALRITGHVRTAAGVPVEGAEVIRSDSGRSWSSRAIVAPLQERSVGGSRAITDATGGYEIDNLVAGSEWLRVGAVDGVAPFQHVPDSDAVVDFTLVAPGSIVGTAPPGAHATAMPTLPDRYPGSANADATGAFEIHHLIPGDYQVGIDYRDGPTVTVPAGGRVTVELH